MSSTVLAATERSNRVNEIQSFLDTEQDSNEAKQHAPNKQSPLNSDYFPTKKLNRAEAEDKENFVTQFHNQIYGWGINHGQFKTQKSLIQTAKKLAFFNVKQVSCGADSFAFVTLTNELWWASAGSAGHLVKLMADVVQVSLGSQVVLALTTAGQVYERKLSDQGAFKVLLHKQIAFVSASQTRLPHLFLTIDGGVIQDSRQVKIEPCVQVSQQLAVGRSGQLYQVTEGNSEALPLARVKRVEASAKICLILTDSGLYQINLKDLSSMPTHLAQIQAPILDFSVSSTHAVALDTEGTVWVWGENKNSELGLGDSVQRELPFPVPNLGNKSFVSIFAGLAFTLAVSQRKIEEHSQARERLSRKKLNINSYQPNENKGVLIPIESNLSFKPDKFKYSQTTRSLSGIANKLKDRLAPFDLGNACCVESKSQIQSLQEQIGLAQQLLKDKEVELGEIYNQVDHLCEVIQKLERDHVHQEQFQAVEKRLQLSLQQKEHLTELNRHLQKRMDELQEVRRVDFDENQSNTEITNGLRSEIMVLKSTVNTQANKISSMKRDLEMQQSYGEQRCQGLAIQIEGQNEEFAEERQSHLNLKGKLQDAQRMYEDASSLIRKQQAELQILRAEDKIRHERRQASIGVFQRQVVAIELASQKQREIDPKLRVMKEDQRISRQEKSQGQQVREFYKTQIRSGSLEEKISKNTLPRSVSQTDRCSNSFQRCVDADESLAAQSLEASPRRIQKDKELLDDSTDPANQQKHQKQDGACVISSDKIITDYVSLASSYKKFNTSFKRR